MFKKIFDWLYMASVRGAFVVEMLFYALVAGFVIVLAFANK